MFSLTEYVKAGGKHCEHLLQLRNVLTLTEFVLSWMIQFLIMSKMPSCR